MHRQKSGIAWAAALLILALIAGTASSLATAQGAGPGQPQRRAGTDGRGVPAGLRLLEPIIGPTSWYDPMDDASGLSWLEGTQLLSDRVRLSLVEVLGGDVDSARVMTEGPGGVLYLGTDQSRLWSYDPATDTTTDLGMPVPDECNN